MACLLLQLAGPLQSWGSSSRFNRRSTDDVPTKSGIVGLLAAAAGRSRSEPVSDLACLPLAVRIDQRGELLRDYHTALVRTGRDSTVTQLSDRYYLSDAVFLAAIEATDDFIETMSDWLRRPVYAPFLGRRSCVPSRPLLLGTSPDNAERAVRTHRWIASERAQRAAHTDAVSVEAVVDCPPGTRDADIRRDQPASFDPVRRVHDWRAVRRITVEIENPLRPRDHHPMGFER